jgi:hypothetical protein
MAHAEIAQVWPRDGRLRLTGRLHKASPGMPGKDDWRLVLELRGEEERRLGYPATLEGTLFDVSLPVADLVADDLPVPAQWDLYLTGDREGGAAADPPTTTRKLRLARLLDDIKGKKKIMVFPAQPVAASSRTVLVKPYYTTHDNLSVECLPQQA